MDDDSGEGESTIDYNRQTSLGLFLGNKGKSFDSALPENSKPRAAAAAMFASSMKNLSSSPTMIKSREATSKPLYQVKFLSKSLAPIANTRS